MPCPIGYSGNNDAAISINDHVYLTESFTPPNRTWQNVTGQNNGDPFECIIPTVMKQDELKATSYLIENDWELLEALFTSKQIVDIITQTQVDVISSIPQFRRETYSGYVSGITVSAVANSDLIKVDYMVQPTTQVLVEATAENLVEEEMAMLQQQEVQPDVVEAPSVETPNQE